MKIVEFENIVDQDEVAHNEPPHLNPHCLPFCIHNIVELGRIFLFLILADASFIHCFFGALCLLFWCFLG